MAVQITTYGGLTTAVAEWLARDGDTDLTNRIDDFIALCESRMYYGKPALQALGVPEHEAIRIPEMYQSNTAFAVVQSGAQPTGLLDLVEAQLNATNAGAAIPLLIVEESILDSQSPYDSNSPSMIALSGNNFRYWPDPGSGSYTLTLRWYGALTTPSGTNATNWILTNAPGVYLNGCLLEAAIRTGDADAAKYYGMLYAADAAALNIRTQRRLASGQNVRIMMRGNTP